MEGNDQFKSCMKSRIWIHKGSLYLINKSFCYISEFKDVEEREGHASSPVGSRTWESQEQVVLETSCVFNCCQISSSNKMLVAVKEGHLFSSHVTQ